MLRGIYVTLYHRSPVTARRKTPRSESYSFATVSPSFGTVRDLVGLTYKWCNSHLIFSVFSVTAEGKFTTSRADIRPC
jgi:hypothetical protein